MKQQSKNTKNSKSKFMLGCATSILSLSMLSAIAVPNWSNSPYNVFADSFQNIDIANGGFDNAGSSFPKTAENWTTLTQNSHIKAGVISTKDEDFSNNYKNYGLFYEKNTVIRNNKSPNAYMMNAQDQSASYGIESSEKTLDANGYYEISVKVCTNVDVLKKSDETKLSLQSSASMYLVVDDKIEQSILTKSTGKHWETFSFFVQTAFLESNTIKLQLYLGSKDTTSTGAVIYDDVTCIKYTKEQYETQKAGVASDHRREFVSEKSVSNASYMASIDASSLILNNSFESGVTDWEKDEEGKSSIKSGVMDATAQNFEGGITTPPETNNQSATSKVLFINNTDNAVCTYTSRPFTIKRYQNFLLQFYVKTLDISGAGVHASIVPTDKEKNYSTITLSPITSSSSPLTNDWSLCSIYMQGSAYEDIEVALELGLGTKEHNNTAKGIVFFDDIHLYDTTYSAYAKATTGSLIQKGTLDSSSSTLGVITNANFNNVNDNHDAGAPYTPANWTASNEDNTQSGIINNRKLGFNTGNEYGSISWETVGLTSAQDFIDASNPEDVSKANQNLLMIKTESNQAQSFISDEAELSTSTLYKLSIDAKSLCDGAYINVTLDDNLIYHEDIAYSDTFILHDFYLLTPMTATKAKIELGVNSSPAVCYAFFDAVNLSTVTLADGKTASETLAGLVEKDEDLRYQNLLNDFSSYNDQSQNANGLYAPILWEDTKNTNANMGVKVDDGKSSLLFANTSQNVEATATLKNAIPLESESYYKITFKFYLGSNVTDATSLTSQLKFGFKECSEENQYFKLSNLSSNENEYSFYINSKDYESITPYITFIGQNLAETTCEYAELVSLSVEKSTEATYQVKQNEVKDDITKGETQIILGSPVSNTETDNGPQNNINSQVFMWIVPSFITLLALVLAVIGSIVKRVNRNNSRKGKKYKNAYDRNTTIHKAILDKEVEKLREEKIAEVRTKILNVQAKLKALEDKYLKDTENTEANKEAEYKKLVRNRKKYANQEVDLKEKEQYYQSEEYTQIALNEVTDKHEKLLSENPEEQSDKEQGNEENVQEQTQSEEANSEDKKND